MTVILHWWLTVENNITYYLQSNHNVNFNIALTVVQQSKGIQAINFTERINSGSNVQFKVPFDTLYNVNLLELLCDKSNMISLMELYFNQSKLLLQLL